MVLLMSTKKPRILLTVDHSLNHKLQTLADLLGEPKARLVTELIKNYEPILDDLIISLEKIRNDKECPVEVVRKFGTDAIMHVLDELAEMSKEVKKL